MNTFSVGLQPKLIRGPPLRSTQKATLMTEDGECVAVDVPRPTSTTVEADLYLPLFKDHIDSSKRGGHNSPLNLVSMVVPFTTLLAAEQSAVLIYHKLNESDIDSESGRFPGLDENGTAMRLTAALETGAQITIYGSAVVFYLQPGKDFHPEPDLQSLHDIIAQDLYIAIKNNLTGGELGSSPDLNRRRLEMVAKMYGTEYRAKSKRPRKNSWKFESMFSGTQFVAATKAKYVTDDRGVTAADRMRQ
ncbi:hypothetical protein FRB90_003608 [Tulasnella sp. 427]|nr:hypothetical protein FRB90_003608 [Tulasnella sp. 427]